MLTCVTDGEPNPTVCVCACVGKSVCVCTLLAVFRVFVTETDQRGESRWRRQNTHCFTGQHAEQCDGEREREGLRSNVLIGACESPTLHDARQKQAQVRATAAGARIRRAPSSPQINRMCVRRLCYHGGLLEIEPRMHTVEAGLLLRCCMSFNSAVSAVHLLQAV